MFQYADGNGNSYILELGNVPELRLNFADPQNGPDSGSPVAQALENKVLSEVSAMELVAAFQLAIDNKLQHSELMTKGTGMIIRKENGLQRRFMLCENCLERRELEALLQKCMLDVG